MIKFFIGPMTKNVVDAILELCQESNFEIGLIPSRRQIEYDGGYVNNWTTEDFSKYTKGLFVMRDHSGPNQGNVSDDGYNSLIVDCEFFDGIHIDPWKKYQDYDSGLSETIAMIKFCHEKNPNLVFEIGTEESIRYFTPDDLDRLVTDLKNNLSEYEFERIKYLVIQSGTSLRENVNTGTYDRDRLLSMLKVSKKHNLMSKEHNGDYQTHDIIKEKFDLGLDSINIAPEFGMIETICYLNHIEKFGRNDLFNLFYQICLDSKKWVKWVSQDFEPEKNKYDLIKICGHYIFSDRLFLEEIKSQFPSIDDTIKNEIKLKLKNLNG